MSSFKMPVGLQAYTEEAGALHTDEAMMAIMDSADLWIDLSDGREEGDTVTEDTMLVEEVRTSLADLMDLVNDAGDEVITMLVIDGAMFYWIASENDVSEILNSITNGSYVMRLEESEPLSSDDRKKMFPFERPWQP